MVSAIGQVVRMHPKHGTELPKGTSVVIECVNEVVEIRKSSTQPSQFQDISKYKYSVLSMRSSSAGNEYTLLSDGLEVIFRDKVLYDDLTRRLACIKTKSSSTLVKSASNAVSRDSSPSFSNFYSSSPMNTINPPIANKLSAPRGNMRATPTPIASSSTLASRTTQLPPKKSSLPASISPPMSSVAPAKPPPIHTAEYTTKSKSSSILGDQPSIDSLPVSSMQRATNTSVPNIKFYQSESALPTPTTPITKYAGTSSSYTAGTSTPPHSGRANGASKENIPATSNYFTTKSSHSYFPHYANSNDYRLTPSNACSTTPGMRNLGNTCFLNAVLQALLNLEGFQLDVLSKFWKRVRGGFTDTDSVSKPSCSLALADLFHLAASSSTTLDPSKVKYALSQVSSRYAGYNQQDAHEFLVDLLDAVHDEMYNCLKEVYGKVVQESAIDNTSPSSIISTRSGTDGGASGGGMDKRRKLTDGSSFDIMADIPLAPVNAEQMQIELDALLPTSRQFQSLVEVTVTCTSCKYSRAKKETYRDLSLIIDNSTDTSSIESLLHKFFSSERRELSCEKCSFGKTADVRCAILELPNVVTIHLKRFEYNERLEAFEKNNQSIVFPLSIDMHPYCSFDHKPGGSSGSASLLEPYILSSNFSTAATSSSTSGNTYENQAEPSLPSIIASAANLSGHQPVKQIGVLSQIRKTMSNFSSMFGAFLGKKRKIHSEISASDRSASSMSGNHKSSTFDDEDSRQMKEAISLSLKESSEWVCWHCSAICSGASGRCIDCGSGKCSAIDGNAAEAVNAGAAVAGDCTDDGDDSDEDSCALPLLTAASSVYKLTAVVRHIGSDCKSGHYVTDILHGKDGSWRRCDDSLVTYISAERVLAELRDAYLLFYVRT